MRVSFEQRLILCLNIFKSRLEVTLANCRVMLEPLDLDMGGITAVSEIMNLS